MYEPLLEDGIRVLRAQFPGRRPCPAHWRADYVGMLDCNCGWPATLSFLKLLRTRFQQDFIAAPDVPWPTEDVATVRAIGDGAGNMTLVLMTEAGHMVRSLPLHAHFGCLRSRAQVTGDQPALVKSIVERWVTNQAWFD